MKVYHEPNLNKMPPSGGVREHIRHLLPALEKLGVQFTSWPYEADLIHVQTAYRPPLNGQVDVWTCHGGFVPPIPQVQQNLETATKIISVAGWVVDEYFPEHWAKTEVIPNGIDLNEWESLPPSGLEPGYVLWGKGFYRADWDLFFCLAYEHPEQRFVSTLCPDIIPPSSNLQVIGVQPFERMQSIMNDCSVYVSTGSEVCPTMVLEAWACGKPVLAWDGDGNTELMEALDLMEVGGALYDDLDGMVEGLKHCLELDGRVGRTWVESYHTWDIVARKTLEVYEGICCNPSL